MPRRRQSESGRWPLRTLALIGATACTPHAPPACPPPPAAPTAKTPAASPSLFDARELAAAQSSPALRERLVGDAYTFFRFINRGFSRRVCERLEALLPALPLVNLHGDLHLEQYAVTGDGRGLTDFDDAALGPPLVDFARLGVSVSLAAELHGLVPSQAIDAMFDGYFSALEDPDDPVPEPAVATRLRGGLSTPADFLGHAETLMAPVAPVDQARITRGYARYVALMQSEHPEHDPDYFTLVKYGRMHTGIGSFLIPRVLLRIEGPSPAPDDDVVLEAKEVESIGTNPCAQRIGGAWQVVLTKARLGFGPDPLLAVVPPVAASSSAPFWVQSWRPDYREVDAHVDVQTAPDLAAVVFDIGHRLGIGHVQYVGAPLESQLRKALIAAITSSEPRMRSELELLTAEVKAAWREFSVAVAKRR